MTPRVSVVIPTRNRCGDLTECLRALEDQTLPEDEFEVLVINDGSSDATAATVERFGRSTRLRLRGIDQSNQGPAAARNLGIAQAKADLVAFIDDDCCPDAAWLEELMAALPGEPRCAGVGGSVRRRRDSTVSRFIDHVGTLAHLQRDGRVHYLVTANALFRRAALEEIRGFDTHFTWPGGEDPDLGDRLRPRGYSLAVTRGAVVRHRHRDTLGGLFCTYVRYGRGEAARVKLGRLAEIWHRSLLLFFICCMGHWGVHASRLLFAPGLRMRERFAFPVLRGIANAGVFIGYVTCPGLAHREGTRRDLAFATDDSRAS